MSLEQYIPFEKKEFRVGQEDAINRVLESIEDGNKFTILNAPVGSGKSVIAYVIAKYLEDNHYKTYLSTGTKILQSQYINDFKDVKTIKGRNNFMCLNEAFLDCTNGMCQSHSNFKCERKPILKDVWEYDGIPLPEHLTLHDSLDGNGPQPIFYGDPVFDKQFLDGMCEYWYQKINGIMAPITMLNYDYLISDVRFVQHLPYRKLLVCDEAHNIEQILMRQLECVFSPSTVFKETGFEITESLVIADWIVQFQEVAELYKKLVKTSSSDKTKKKMLEKYEKFSILSKLLENDSSNWVFVKDKKFNVEFYTFKPIKVSDYTENVFGIAEHVLLMSGTILKQDIFARDLGIDNFEYIEIPSIIPPKNRPIIKKYVGSMASSSIDITMPNMISTIEMLADKHSDEKGVIHTFTYNVAKRLQQGLRGNNRFMFHTSKDKEQVFKKFKKDSTNKILVSPVAYEGIDFPYDQARWQCICKEPFPNIRDPQVSVRDSVDYGWVFRQRCLVLSQMYGRTNRAKDDYSVTYLLDSRIETLLGDASLATDYFFEGLQDSHYNAKLVLNESAYDKLTKDNSRKDHSFDRKVEKQVLSDIEDGYDSLGALRREYKKFPSDAYKYITPAVNRLVKHGAVRYE